MTTSHQEEMTHASKCIAELEAGLKFEVETSNEQRSKAEAHHETIQELRRELESEKSRHHDEVQLLKSEYDAQVEELETHGAAVVSDFEESIKSLKEEIARNTTQHKQAMSQVNQQISRAHTQKEMLERQLAEYEKRAASHEEKIVQLNNLSQHRGEEIIVLQKELTFHRDAMDIAKRDHSSAIDAITRELDDARLTYQHENNELQLTNDELRSQLDAVNAKLDAENAELNEVKSKLEERTQLLKNMVSQTKAYKSDYEQECCRYKQLNETVERYKSELSEVRSRLKHFEHEKNDQEKKFQEALRKERQQRKTIEKQLELKVQSIDEVIKKYNEMEKENASLKVRQLSTLTSKHVMQRTDIVIFIVFRTK
jgi:chromosome segregation ATPase